MLNITRRDVEDAIKYAGSVNRSLSPMRVHGEYLAGTIACQAESGLAAFGYGVLEGRSKGPIKIGPVSLDLIAALALHGAGFLGLTGKFAGHTHNFAQGLADGYLHRLGIGIGTAMGIKAGGGFAPHFVSGGTNPRGRFDDTQRGHHHHSHPMSVGAEAPRRPAPLTAAEIAALAQQRMA